MNKKDKSKDKYAAAGEEKRKKNLVRAILADFEARQNARRSLERSWQLNMNFVSGNQFCDISPSGEIKEEDTSFYWQSRRAFNHIAPTVDTRVARLSKVRPLLNVRAASDSDDDVKTARLCSNILKAVKCRIDLDSVIARASLWSETCGTAFYKVVWNYDDGQVIGTDDKGHALREGDVNVVALSPFEVYPDTLTAESMNEVKSIIHAKAVPVSEIKEKFGVEIAGRQIEEFSLVPFSAASGWKRPLDGESRPILTDHEILIERYTRPCGEFPNGRLEIVAGDKLLFEGDLPYLNGDRGERTLPFIRQTSISLAGAFFGTSVVDRMIPLQRAYNAVRNRKHEFLNRLSAGVIAVEDGSVDAEELAEDGLYPGKVLVYRQGSTQPNFLDCGKLPAEFAEEEERIANEFVLVSGMSEISRNSANPTNVTSAVGLQLLLDQDTNRMLTSVESVERAIKEAGKQILHLYKQFASARRVLRMTGTGGNTELYYFSSSDISADDVEFETGYEKTPSEKREELLSLYSLGLLADEEGKLTGETRNKVLEALGYGTLDNARDVSHLHLKKAERENVILQQKDAEAEEYDDHALHIAEHTRALLSGGEDDGAVKERFIRHIQSHRQKEGK
ncbi:MAG: hypothetical protein K2L87_00055 [Clostridiales bacterium]|nr:hypothetical protein [Clostridiales bacterium]